MKAAVALGANLGDREAHLRQGLDLLAHPLTALSSLYETDPVGPVPQGPFLNAALTLEWAGTPRELLERLLEVERQAGRCRVVPKGPRTLDLDLLLFGTETVRDKDLIVPHPALTKRAFALVPLLEIWPDARLPEGGSLKACLKDTKGVRLFRKVGWHRTVTS